ncbi:MAG: AAA family ATPase [Gemmatimonadaceae bacterium]
MYQATHPNAPLTLRTLGSVGLYAANGNDIVLGAGKPLALVVFLAFAPGKQASRESLIDLLWADVDPDRGRSSLRQTLFVLRRLLGDDSINGTEELTLKLPFVADRDEFLRALESNELDKAIALYTGAYLPAFGVPGGATFEHWADLERERLESGFMRAAELLVRRHLNQSHIKDGKQIARRLRDLVPRSEVGARLMLEACIAGRDFVSAAMEADVIEQWAVQETVVLEPATRSAIARARRIALVEDDGKAFELVAELTGREQEFFAITSAWESVRIGPARHLHLSAPAGIGKTRLLRDAVARLVAAGAPVLQLRGAPGNSDVPYAFAGDLAAAVASLPGAAGIAPASASALLALNPTLSSRMTGVADTTLGEDALRRRILAIADLVHSVADEKRFVLAIDDLHWIDELSFRVLQGVLTRLENAHVLCLTTSRPGRVGGDERSTVMHLEPLTVANVDALVSALGAIPTSEKWTQGFIHGLHEATRGSPLLVLETLRLALDQETLALESNEWRCLNPAKLSVQLQAGEALRERIRRLPNQQLLLLALLATSGMPLNAADFAEMAELSSDDFRMQLEPLERQGLITIGASGWMPAHDEIADAARASLTSEELRANEQRVGTYFARVARGDPNGMMRAARHLVAANDDDGVRALFNRYALVMRERGDRRSFSALAAELTGAQESASVVAPVVSSLPALWRMGLWSNKRRIVAVMAILLLPIVTAGTLRARAMNEATLQRLYFVDSAKATSVVAIHPNDFDGNKAALERARGSSIQFDAATRYTELPPAISPDGKSAAWIQDSGDSTILDIWLRTPAGVRRLTFEPRDDLAHEWLPDGSGLVGTTNRWSPKGDGDYDIAVFDTATGSARQITHGHDYDSGPSMSPDGTRVAFTRLSDAFPQRLCVTTIDGVNEPECRLIDNKQVSRVIGWNGLTELVLLMSGSYPAVVVYDWARSSSRMILSPQARDARLSPDRKWVVATIRVDGVRGNQDWIAPIDHPGQARPVEHSGSGALPARWWEGRTDHSLLIDHIEFIDTNSVIPLGAGTRLRIRQLTSAGTEIPILVPIKWTSSDTLVASVDSMGVVIPHAIGDVSIAANLVNWRKVSRRMHVIGRASQVVLDERWSNDWKRRWIAWGDPAPFVGKSADGVSSFFNNGDGTFHNLAVLRESLSAQNGLGAELLISSKFTRTKWQRVQAFLTADIDTAALLSSDQKGAPASMGRLDATCGFNFPTDGKWGETRLSFLGSISDELDLKAGALPLRTGAWWKLRLQILPDGRCGVAINNKVVWISPEPIPLTGAFRLRLGDSSNGTNIMHGPLQIWTGVRTDIDWRALR